MSKQFNTRSRINKKKVTSKRNVSTSTYKLSGLNPPRENWQDVYERYKKTKVGSHVLCTSNIAFNYPQSFEFVRNKSYEIVGLDIYNATLINEEGKERTISIEDLNKNFKLSV